MTGDEGQPVTGAGRHIHDGIGNLGIVIIVDGLDLIIVALACGGLDADDIADLEIGLDYVEITQLAAVLIMACNDDISAAYGIAAVPEPCGAVMRAGRLIGIKVF